MGNEQCEVCENKTGACTFEHACACWYGVPCVEVRPGASMREVSKAKADNT